RPRPQVVPVAEAAGQDHHIRVTQVALAMPDEVGLAPPIRAHRSAVRLSRTSETRLALPVRAQRSTWRGSLVGETARPQHFLGGAVAVVIAVRAGERDDGDPELN